VLPHEGEAEDDGVADQDQPVCGPERLAREEAEGERGVVEARERLAADWSACGIWLTD